MNFLVQWFFPEKRAAQLLQMLQENDAAYGRQFFAFEHVVELERLEFDAEMVEFQNRKIEIMGLKLNMEDRWTEFKMRLLDFILQKDPYLPGNYWFLPNESQPEASECLRMERRKRAWQDFYSYFDVVVRGPEAGDMDLGTELKASHMLIEHSRDLISCFMDEEGVTELENHLGSLEARHEAVTVLRTLFEDCKVAMKNNEQKLKSLSDDLEVQRRNYDAYQRMRSIGPYSPSRTQPIGRIGLYLPWINALNGWIGERFGWTGLYFPWIHGTMAERENNAVGDEAVGDEDGVDDGIEAVGENNAVGDEAVGDEDGVDDGIEAVGENDAVGDEAVGEDGVEDGIEAVAYEIDDEFERGMM